MSFRILRRDTEIRFATKFGGNRPLRSCRKVVWFTTQKNSRSAVLVPAPILPQMGRSRPKLPERCRYLTRPPIPNLVRIGCVFAGFIPERLIFRPEKSLQYSLSAYNKQCFVNIRDSKMWTLWTLRSQQRPAHKYFLTYGTIYTMFDRKMSFLARFGRDINCAISLRLPVYRSRDVFAARCYA